MWRRVFGWVLPDVSTGCSAFILTAKSFNKNSLTVWPWRHRHNDRSKRRELLIQWHGLTSQVTRIFTSTTACLHRCKSGDVALTFCHQQCKTTTNTTAPLQTTASSRPLKKIFRARSRWRRRCWELCHSGTVPLCLTSRVGNGCWWCAMAPAYEAS